MNNFSLYRLARRTSALLLLVLLGSSAYAQEQQLFETADQAVNALVEALEKNDLAALGVLLGPDSEEILSSGDSVADANARADFLERYQAHHALIAEGDDRMVLEIGANNWPFPVPIIKRDGRWLLSGAEGADELIYRRVGRNELGAIAVCRGFVDAQFDYSEQGHDGNPVGLFSAKFHSDPGLQNGLYWPAAEGEPPSPIGPGVAAAVAEGYRAATEGKRNPYHGYYYRMLFAQGTHAKGGALEYFVDGQLIQGVALLAWPADYGASGIKSFMINLDGVVYEKDLGEDTPQLAEAMQVFDPDSSWSVVTGE